MEDDEIPTNRCRRNDDNLSLTMDTANKRYKSCSNDTIENGVDNNNHEVLSSNKTTSTTMTTTTSSTITTDNNDTKQQPSTKKPPPPKYGSIQYWNERYQKQFQRIGVKVNENDTNHEAIEAATTTSTTTGNNTNNIENGNNKDDITTLPFHSWYFTYDELRPILLPLLLGGCSDMIQPYIASDVEHDDLQLPEIIHNAIGQEIEPSNASIENKKLSYNSYDDIDNENEQNEEDDDVDEGVDQNKVEEKKEDEEEEEEEEEEADNIEDEGEWEEVEDDDDKNEVDDSETDDNDDEIPEREGLAKDGPVSILEIGCGDVPLGAALAYEFRNILCMGLSPTSFSKLNENKKLSIITKILCTDYSPVVVEMMQKQYCNSNDAHDQNQTSIDDNDIDTTATSSTEISKDVIATGHVGSVPLQFEVMDARRIPHGDNSFHMILEKGTLDAVLSDPVNGIADCVQIVSECARVASGCIVLVSHLNAHTPNGLGWLEEVVMEGLKKYSIRHDSNVAEWDIEVHGNSDVIDDDNNNRFPPGSTGPAVYVIHKVIKPYHLEEATSSVTVTKRDGTNDTVKDGTTSAQDDMDIVPINVQFFSY